MIGDNRGKVSKYARDQGNWIKRSFSPFPLIVDLRSSKAIDWLKSQGRQRRCFFAQYVIDLWSLLPQGG